jgi:hypothetical protein
MDGVGEGGRGFVRATAKLDFFGISTCSISLVLLMEVVPLRMMLEGVEQPVPLLEAGSTVVEMRIGVRTVSVDIGSTGAADGTLLNFFSVEDPAWSESISTALKPFVIPEDSAFTVLLTYLKRRDGEEGVVAGSSEIVPDVERSAEAYIGWISLVGKAFLT